MTQKKFSLIPGSITRFFILMVIVLLATMGVMIQSFFWVIAWQSCSVVFVNRMLRHSDGQHNEYWQEVITRFFILMVIVLLATMGVMIQSSVNTWLKDRSYFPDSRRPASAASPADHRLRYLSWWRQCCRKSARSALMTARRLR
jgi:RsiW-degrading membrane proteinase PrsW (M82 family)